MQCEELSTSGEEAGPTPRKQIKQNVNSGMSLDICIIPLLVLY